MCGVGVHYLMYLIWITLGYERVSTAFCIQYINAMISFIFMLLTVCSWLLHNTILLDLNQNTEGAQKSGDDVLFTMEGSGNSSSYSRRPGFTSLYTSIQDVHHRNPSEPKL